MIVAGVVEIALAVAVVVFWKQSWPVLLSAVAFCCLLAGAIVLKPMIATEAFNPVSLSVAAIVLCLINWNSKVA